MYSNVQYILVTIGVLYSVQFNVQYSLELRMRNVLHEAGWGLFFRKKCSAEIFFNVWHQLFVEYSTVNSVQTNARISISTNSQD